MKNRLSNTISRVSGSNETRRLGRGWFVVVLIALSWVGLHALGPFLRDFGTIGHHAKKLSEMFLALLSIQLLSAALSEKFGTLIGSGLSAFIGGLISSTAMTAEIAKRTKSSDSDVHLFEFLASLLAMLVEACVIVAVGTGLFQSSVWILFALPVGVTLYGVLKQSRLHLESHSGGLSQSNSLISNLRLAFLLVLLTALSFYGVKVLGNASLYVVTLVASLFEVHAVTITNANLHDSGVLSDRQLGDLVALSILASLASKLILVGSFGSHSFFRQTIRWAVAIVGALALAWFVFRVV